MKIRKFIGRITFIFKFWKFIPFLVDFYKSREVPLYQKVVGVLAVLTYFIFPFDLIPDFLLLFGLIDDVVITSFVFERLVKIAPEALKEKYELTSTSNLRKG
ncbi:DUF1232 domain-containing protein [Virgibacillus halodenitrificans]|nr:DUF1232 domain-containing protein [Virgibacillus halodenitrificans]